MDLGEVEVTVARWDAEIKAYRESASIALQGETALTNRKLELAKTLRALADEIDPPRRNIAREEVWR